MQLASIAPHRRSARPGHVKLGGDLVPDRWRPGPKLLGTMSSDSPRNTAWSRTRANRSRCLISLALGVRAEVALESAPPGIGRHPALARGSGPGGAGVALLVAHLTVMGAPSGTVTFLFTDIEGSTRLWQLDEGAMGLAVSRHDELLRAAIQDCGGTIFSTMGDGFAAAFPSVHTALQAAQAAQERLARQEWPTPEPVRVRMGLHTGEAEERHGDYFGTAVNRAARLMAVGHGGQILCSSATAELLDGDVGMVDLGEHRLRDLDRPVRVFQIGEGRFPRLRYVDLAPGNLSLPASSFVGRRRELAEVSAAVSGCRLVTLTGVGGVGKTRLALQTGAALMGDFPDGVFVVELAAVSDPGAVPDVVAAVMGVIPQPGLSVTQSVASALEGRRRLLIVDNCEQVLDAVAELVSQILVGSATVKVLATSREPLRVAEEQVWPVPSLSVAGDEADAVALFTERAQAVAPRFSLDAEGDRAVVEEICRRLDGIPLAIELAASRMASMSPHEVRDRLHDRFRLLSGARRGLERHQTLRNAVQWSYDLLSPEEQGLLDRCSVFAGGFDLPAAVALCGGADELEVLDLLASLVRKSLMVAERVATGTRYAMLETIRQFGEERLAASGLSDQIRDLHARHYRVMEAPVMELWNGPNQKQAYEWLDHELANLRAAFQWAAQTDDLDTAATIAVFAALLCDICGLSAEPITWAEQVLPAATQVRHWLLLALYQAAAWCAFYGRPDEGVAYADAARALYGDPSFEQNIYGIGASLGCGAYVHTQPLDRWVAAGREVLAVADDPLLANRVSLAVALTFTGHADEALSLCDGLVQTAAATGNPYACASAVLALGYAQAQFDPTSAVATLRQCLELTRRSCMPRMETSTYVALARLEIATGHYRPALDLLRDATRVNFDAGEFSALIHPLALICTLLVSCDLPEPAATIAGFATTSFALAAYPEFAAAVEQLRETLGDDDFDRLGQRGQSTSRPEMVAYALRAIEEARIRLDQPDPAEPTSQ
jgi:predicted ATPase/class 3 adenylate cyclase